MECFNLSAYSGITFWAKGTAAPVEVSLSGVMVTSVRDPKYSGGTCPSNPSGCSARYDITGLTTDWQHYTIKWGDFSLTGVAAPLDVTAVNGVNFEMAGSGVLDLWIDQVGFTSN